MDCDNSIPCNYYKNFCLIFLCLYSSSKFAVCCTVEPFRKTLWEILRFWRKKIHDGIFSRKEGEEEVAEEEVQTERSGEEREEEVEEEEV